MWYVARSTVRFRLAADDRRGGEGEHQRVLILFAVTAGIWVATLAVTVGVIALMVRLLDYLDRGAGPDDSDGEGGGGDERPPQPGGDEPEWWAGFEREFELHVRTQHGDQAAAGRDVGRVGGSSPAAR
jgi:hypothetical protein